MTVSVNRDACVGSGMCVLTAPEVFDQSETDALVVVLTPRPEGEQRASAREAARLCPGRAISVEWGNSPRRAR